MLIQLATSVCVCRCSTCKWMDPMMLSLYVLAVEPLEKVLNDHNNCYKIHIDMCNVLFSEHFCSDVSQRISHGCRELTDVFSTFSSWLMKLYLFFSSSRCCTMEWNGNFRYVSEDSHGGTWGRHSLTVQCTDYRQKKQMVQDRSKRSLLCSPRASQRRTTQWLPTWIQGFLETVLKKNAFTKIHCIHWQLRREKNRRNWSSLKY